MTIKVLDIGRLTVSVEYDYEPMIHYYKDGTGHPGCYTLLNVEVLEFDKILSRDDLLKIGKLHWLDAYAYYLVEKDRESGEIVSLKT